MNFFTYLTFYLILSVVCVSLAFAEPVFTVNGTVEILLDGQSLEPDDEDNEPSLVALNPLSAKTVTSSPKVIRVEMQNKRFSPRYLTAQIGDEVSFPNFDSFDHNVFSPAEQGKFDLGAYSKGGSRSHKFSEVGLYQVYCNVHSSMASFVMVHNGPWATVTKPTGGFSIPNVPAGEYELHAWNVRGELKKTVKVGSQLPKSILVEIDASREKDLSHLNKFGKAYGDKKKSSSRNMVDDDEFY